MPKNNFFKLASIFFLLLFVVFIQTKTALAGLPTLPTTSSVGGSCSVDEDCTLPLACRQGICVQCQDSNQCSSGKICDNGVCVLGGGNATGSFCRSDNQCASGKCGVNNLCVETKTVPAGGMSATGGGTKSLPGENLSIQDVFNIINGIACWLLRVVTAVMVIFLVLAGLRFMWARGDPTRTITARKNLRYVLWGILVVMGVYVIIATVANAVGASFSFIPLRC